jgi:hypothetical protein
MHIAVDANGERDQSAQQSLAVGVIGHA